MLHHQQPRAAIAIPLPKRLPRGMRDQITDAIERHQAAMDGLIALLDVVDGDTDAEPSLGAQDPAWENTNQEIWANSNGDDREGDEHDGREPDVDGEYSLGWPGGVDQVRALKNSHGTVALPGGDWVERNSDNEAEHDGREPEDFT